MKPNPIEYKLHMAQQDIVRLEAEVDYHRRETGKYRELYKAEHHRLLGALLSIQAVTKREEPKLFMAG